MGFLIENYYFCKVYNIIARATLLFYCKKYPEAATALQEWYHEFVRCSFRNFNPDFAVDPISIVIY
jgi:hypothetical protein